jgi:Predicted membrane protein (DUF2142)
MIFLRRLGLKTLVRYVGLVMSLAVALGAWAYASPVGSDPDGNFHLASIWCGDGYKVGQCEPPSAESKDAVPKVVKVPNGVATANGCRPQEATYSASCTNGLILQRQMVETNYNNAGRLYPNGFYWVASHFVSDNVAETITKIRLMNVLLFVLLITAANIILPSAIKKSLNITHLLLLMPLGLFLVASNNPSSWAISGLGTFWAFLYGFLTMEDRSKIIAAGVFTVVSAMMAIQARADSAAFVVVVSAVVTAHAFSSNPQNRSQIYQRLALPLLIFVPAYIAYTNAGQNRAISSGLLGDISYGRDPLAIFLWNITRLPGMFAGVFGYPGAGGGLGWLDVAMPEIVSLGMLFLVAFLVSKASRSRPIIEVVALVLFMGIIVAMPLIILQQDGGIVGENFQSRYLLPSLLVAGGLYFSRSTIFDGDQKLMSTKILTGLILVIAYLVALHTTIRRYVTGNDVMDWNLNRAREWWWEGMSPPMTVFVVGSLAFSILITLLLNVNKETKSTATS